jgi:hypothetical protein
MVSLRSVVIVTLFTGALAAPAPIPTAKPSLKSASVGMGAIADLVDSEISDLVKPTTITSTRTKTILHTHVVTATPTADASDANSTN